MNGRRLDDPTETRPICQLAPIADGARDCLAENQTPRQLIEALTQANLFHDATWVLGYAMTPSQAVQWLCRSIREIGEPPTADSPAMEALNAAERWLQEPSDDHRRQAKAAADQSGLDHPAGCAAMAVFLSGGSLAPPGLPEVPPAPHHASHLAAAGALLNAVRIEPEKAPEKLKRMIALGFEISAETDGPSATPPAPAIHRPAQAEPRKSSETLSQAPEKSSSTTSTTPSRPARKRWDDWE